MTRSRNQHGRCMSCIIAHKGLKKSGSAEVRWRTDVFGVKGNVQVGRMVLVSSYNKIAGVFGCVGFMQIFGKRINTILGFFFCGVRQHIVAIVGRRFGVVLFLYGCFLYLLRAVDKRQADGEPGQRQQHKEAIALGF